MGGLPWDVAARDLPVPEAISQRRAALGIPQATPRAQEAPPQAAKRGQGQACGDGQTAPDTQDQSTKTSKSVYNIISTQGCQHRANQPAQGHEQRKGRVLLERSRGDAHEKQQPRQGVVLKHDLAYASQEDLHPFLGRVTVDHAWRQLSDLAHEPLARDCCQDRAGSAAHRLSRRDPRIARPDTKKHSRYLNGSRCKNSCNRQEMTTQFLARKRRTVCKCIIDSNPLSSFNTLWFRYAMFFQRKKGAGRYWIDIGRRFGPTSDGRPT